jgi:hypothetical protein
MIAGAACLGLSRHCAFTSPCITKVYALNEALEQGMVIVYVVICISNPSDLS